MPGQVSITFDDGLASVYWLAFPELEKYGIMGTAFVISGLVGGHYFQRPVMNEKMLLDLSSAGWEIGSHTMTHQDLVSLPNERVNEEMKLSKQHLESMIRKPVTSLAYPYGQFDSRIALYAQRHYDWGRTATHYPPLKLNQSNPRDRMQLKAMSASEPAYTLPLHLCDTYLPRPIKRTFHSLLGSEWNVNSFVQSGTQHHLGGIIQTCLTGLNARIVAKWIRKTREGNAWLILCFHNISPQRTPDPDDVFLEEFRDIVRTVAEGTPSVVTIGSEEK